MEKQLVEGDRLYLIAESLAKDFSLFPTTDVEEPLPGLLGEREILRQRDRLAKLDVDSYIEAVVARAEDPGRTAAPEVIRQLGRVVEEQSDGPFYAATVVMDFLGEQRSVGFIAQNRAVKNGVWMPQHHLMAAERVQACSQRRLPIVTLMDTPGADAGEEANRHNQAHSISRLIAEMSNVDVPNIGIIFGLGYSGGAIPLAASNVILSVRDGVFSTIQPKGLANIARRLNLSWQECAKYVGLSPFELYSQGNIDGVIDYAPGETGDKLENFRGAIVAGLLASGVHMQQALALKGLSVNVRVEVEADARRLSELGHLRLELVAARRRAGIVHQALVPDALALEPRESSPLVRVAVIDVRRLLAEEAKRPARDVER